MHVIPIIEFLRQSELFRDPFLAYLARPALWVQVAAPSTLCGLEASGILPNRITEGVKT